MRKLRVSIFGCLLLVMAAMSVAPARSQGLPSKKDAGPILEKAEAKMALTTPGAPPFYLVAKLHYRLGATGFDGVYELMWTAPDRYREEFRLGQISSTYLALGDKLYIQRNTPLLTYPQWRLRTMLGLPTPALFAPKISVDKVSESQDGATQLACAKMISPFGTETDCFTQDTGNLVSMQFKMENLPISYTKENFADLGDYRFPKHILSIIANESLEVTLDKLMAARFSDDVFAPPAGAEVHDWCAKPDAGERKGEDFYAWLSRQESLRPEGPQGSNSPQGFYIQVGKDGRVDTLSQMFRDGSSKPLNAKTAGSVRFGVLSCGGKPIDYELNMAAVPPPPAP